jgi:hypothetical protein
VDFALIGTGGLTAAFQIIAQARVLELVIPVFLIAPLGGEAIEAAARATGAAGVIAWPKEWEKLARRLAVLPL